MRALVVGALLGSLVPACGLLAEEGSGVTVQRRVRVTAEVTRVEVADGFVAEIRVGGAPAGTVTIDDNLVDRLRVAVDGDALSIGLDGRVRDATLRVAIAVPALTSVAASDASEVTVAGTLVGDVSVEADGASSVAVTLVEADRLEIDARASGASELAISGVEAERATVVAAGASRIELRVLDELDARASGASTVTYGGSPTRVLVDSSGSSRVERA